ncbi:hypothetical protein Misp02_49340 [Microtetraspora sp. NBRC 16547]|nr:hypothetical protein Misp02_49340 [Microtetraspora sp. NBRC 16547]
MPDKPSFDIRPGGLNPERVDDLARRVHQALSGGGGMTAHQMLAEFTRIVVDASESAMGYDTQQVVRATEEWAQRFEEMQPGYGKRFLGVSFATWRNVIPGLIWVALCLALIVVWTIG